MLMKLRLVGKFIVWILLGIVTRIFGGKSIFGSYYRWCKQKMEDREPEMVVIWLVVPLLSFLLALAVCAASGMPEKQAVYASSNAIYAIMSWNIVVFIHVLWDKFIREYEQSFRILKDE